MGIQGAFGYIIGKKKRMIREAIQKKRKVEEAMNNLPIHEQENIKEVLKKIEDDGKSINIDEITRQNIARHKKTTSKAKIIKYEFINDE
jgi:Zn-finger protein